ALAAKGPEEQRRIVIAEFVRYFGKDAAEPIAYAAQDWAGEVWTRGCPTATMGPGTMTLFGPALRAPGGRLHRAGTETATEYCGYMEGAVQSGERVASEIGARL